MPPKFPALSGKSAICIARWASNLNQNISIRRSRPSNSCCTNIPTSTFREEAQLAIAAIQRNNLGQTNLAQKSYQDFLSDHPHSPHAEEARKALAEIRASDKAEAASVIPAPPANAAPPAPKDISSEASEVGQVRVWNADTYTRIIIPLAGQAKYQAARISDPDRIYFDIEGAKLGAKLNAPVDVPTAAT